MMAMPYNWMSISANGALPAASAVGPSSPYWRIQPFSGIAGPASAWPRMALQPGSAAALESGAGGGGLVRQALQLGPGAAATSAVRGPGLGVGTGPALSRMATPAAEGLIGAARGPVTSATGAAARGLSNIAPGMWRAGNAEALLGPGLKAGGGGLVNAARGTIGLAPVAEGATGVRAALAGVGGKVLLPAGIAMGGLQAGGMLDESNWLGGSESAANDTASKMLKWGGTGAGIGLLFGGPMGAAIGAGAGGLIGAGQEWLERQGVLKAPTIQEQIDDTIHGADRAAREIGVPDEVLGALKQQYRAQAAFLEPGDKANRTLLADEYAARVQEQATAFAADPNSFLKSTTTNADPAKRAMLMRSLLVNTIKPYADNYLAQSEATAQSLENMAASAGDLAPMYQQQAASTRQMGAMYAGNLVNQAQVTPYMQALTDQASYLNSMSSNLMQQAMGQVMQGQQQPAAGSTDITSIIDQTANQLQPQ